MSSSQFPPRRDRRTGTTSGPDGLALARADITAGSHHRAAERARAILAANQDHPEALHVLGSAIYALGNPVEALGPLRLAVAGDPGRADFHNDLGTAECAAELLPEAEVSYRRALALYPDHAQAHNNLGTVLAQLGDNHQALVHYDRALALAPGYAEAQGNRGNALRDIGRLAEAEVACHQAIAYAPRSAQLWRNLAALYLAAGEISGALKAVCEALLLQDDDANRALCARILRYGPPVTDEVSMLLLRALKEGWGRPGDLGPAVISLLRRRHEDDGGKVLRDPLFLALLCCTPVCDIWLEGLLVNARRVMLESVNLPWKEVELEFHAALAHQCFINEYIFPASPAEEALVATLGAGLQHLVARAAYQPLHACPDAEALLDHRWPAPVANLLRQQVAEPREEQRLRCTIPTITLIRDATSIRVRQQYEAHPYPRWTAAGSPGVTSLSAYLRGRFPKARFTSRQVCDVLIAGCGTGRTAIECAHLLGSGARLLALDLSVASLAYAKRKAQELDINNIAFAQGDLTLLRGQQFDFINAGGVLHHIADPLSGWRNLRQLLRPGGFMQIGLYSAAGRRCLQQVRSSASWPRSNAALRHAREIILRQSNFAGPLFGCSDFYALSEFRDLLFHEQEHVFVLPQIAEFLRQEGLAFIGMDVDESTQHRFENISGNVDEVMCWDAFEKTYPETFMGMYQFWVHSAR
jgi:tetratricopeptide (TPR) repeat protein/SAM-dependent methyltransferase